MFYVLLSAVLFLMPYFFPAVSIPCSFIFLIPLILQSKKAPLTFFNGFVWGLIVFGIHCYWFLVLITTKGLAVAAVSLWIVTIGWLCVCASLWLQVTCYSWLLSTVLFFLFITYGCMIPLGQLDGYPFFNPLIPLCYYPQLTWCLKYIGTIGALSCLTLFQVCLVQKKVVLSFLCLLPFLAGLFFYQEKIIPTSHMHYLKPWWYGHHSPMFVGYRMVHDIGEVINAHPQTACILMPESTFCFDIHEHQKFIPLWCEPDCDVAVMFGGHRCVEGKTLNSFMCLRSGEITYCYDKQHLIPFVETIPKVCALFGCGEFFISVGDTVDVPKRLENNKDIIELCGQTYQIFICSELFFEAKPVKGFPIILVWNESWFCCEYMKNLAVLFIKYFELKYDVVVLYASTEGRNNL